MRLSRARRSRVFTGVMLGAVTLGAVVAGCNAWVAIASRGGLFTADDVPHRPVALVLGAGVYPDGTPSPFLAARLDTAADLLRRGKVDVLLVSGDNRTEHYDEPTAMRTYLLAHGVDDRRIVTDFAGRDTYDSCVRARRIFGVTEVTLVSQTYHLPRALAVCRGTGLNAVAVGDTTMVDYAPGAWQSGVARETLAAVKAAGDVISHRDPVLGPPESTVTDRLREFGTTTP